MGKLSNQNGGDESNWSKIAGSSKDKNQSRDNKRGHGLRQLPPVQPSLRGPSGEQGRGVFMNSSPKGSNEHMMKGIQEYDAQQLAAIQKKKDDKAAEQKWILADAEAERDKMNRHNMGEVAKAKAAAHADPSTPAIQVPQRTHGKVKVLAKSSGTYMALIATLPSNSTPSPPNLPLAPGDTVQFQYHSPSVKEQQDARNRALRETLQKATNKRQEE